MALTKTDIFLIVQKRLGPLAQQVTDIDVELLETLNDLSSRHNFIITSATADSVDGVHTVAAPGGCRYILLAAVDEGDYLERGSLEDYEKSIEDTDSPTEGEPNKYHQIGELIYLYDPIPDDAYTVRFWYAERDDAVASIQLAERFREAIIYGVLYRLCNGVLQPDPFKENSAQVQNVISGRAQMYQLQYETQIQLLRRDTLSEPKQIKFRDI